MVRSGVRLGLPLCVPHQCHCGSLAFVGKQAAGRSGRHHAINDLIAWVFALVGILVTKEPDGLLWSDGKRLDGLTLIPWQAVKLC